MPNPSLSSTRNGMDAWMYRNHSAENFLTGLRRYPSGRFERKVTPTRIITLSANGILRIRVIKAMRHNRTFKGGGQALEKHFAAHELPGQLFFRLIKKSLALPRFYQSSFE